MSRSSLFLYVSISLQMGKSHLNILSSEVEIIIKALDLISLLLEIPLLCPSLGCYIPLDHYNLITVHSSLFPLWQSTSLIFFSVFNSIAISQISLQIISANDFLQWLPYIPCHYFIFEYSNELAHYFLINEDL